MLLKKIVKKILSYTCRISNGRYTKYLTRNGVKIGEGTKFRPFTTEIDLTRPSLISIGSNCYFNKNLVILTHDWVSRVFIYSGRDFLPSSGKVVIGNNVSTGQNVTILKGVSIGDNVFIGANSVVTRDIPSNSIAVGIPCKVVMSLDDYFEKRKKQAEKEALEYALSIQQRFGRRPVETDFKEEFIYFVDGDKIDQHFEISERIKFQLGPTYERYKESHIAKYDSFDAFLQEAGIK